MQIDQFESNVFKFLAECDVADKAHDIEHLKRVTALAKSIAISERAKLEVVVPAAWLHDCVNLPKNHPENHLASTMAADKAVAWLAQIGYPAKWLDDIHHAIAAHSYSAKITARTLEAQIVQDADRMDGLGALGVSRCMLVAGKLDTHIYWPDDPFCSHRAPDSKKAAVDHFFEKLFVTAQQMNTAVGKTEAARRVTFMKSFLAQLDSEINGSLSTISFDKA